jgi:2-polyprenyl-3-methyl-5-hydroxy-6-metoxy-1,4-benzoquinol methylase
MTEARFFRSEYQEYHWSEKWNDDHLYKTLLGLLNKKENTKILDVGCGNGYIVNKLLEEGFDIYGVDASVSGIEVAKRQNPTRFFLVDINFMKLPVELNMIKFDTIISTEVIEHLYDPRGFVKLCMSILNANGRGEIIFSTPYHGYLKNLAISILNGWDKHFTSLWDGGHIKFWSPRTLTQLLEEAGFKVNGFKGSGRLPYFWKSMFIRAGL